MRKGCRTFRDSGRVPDVSGAPVDGCCAQGLVSTWRRRPLAGAHSSPSLPSLSALFALSVKPSGMAAGSTTGLSRLIG
ncbi:hypothetical protein NPIL_600341 [Nephila pilipes]|uniref:Uncharacterized protein n=1 Tax=Nephila pilipes TaxID=299642 RepID=A0A8X6P3N2_NEPPI|nr:hypothetical protein NPIL_600341 [Nephila pilipes]